MTANRRTFLKLLSAGLIGHTLDVDKLLWIPGEKKIFIPSQRQIDFVYGRMSLTEVIEIEWMKVMPKIKELFEKDSVFFEHINR